MRQRNSFDPFGSIKASLKNWLLPHPFKITGQILLFAVLVALVIQIVVTNVLPDDGYISLDMEGMQQLMLFRRVISVALYLAVFFITCSREKIEDEMTSQLRGEALKEICYVVIVIYIAAHIALTIFSDNMPYITRDESSFVPFIIWALYYGRFEHKLKTLRRQSRGFKL